jgi:hypothetical protein
MTNANQQPRKSLDLGCIMTDVHIHPTRPAFQPII